MDRTWTIVGVGGSPRLPSSGIPGEEDQVGPCEQLDALSSFNPLAKCGKRGELPVPGSPVTGFPGTTRILRMGFQLSTFCFEILRRVALWRAQYDESCKLCSGGSYCLSLASMVESVGEA